MSNVRGFIAGLGAAAVLVVGGVTAMAAINDAGEPDEQPAVVNEQPAEREVSEPVSVSEDAEVDFEQTEVVVVEDEPTQEPDPVETTEPVAPVTDPAPAPTYEAPAPAPEPTEAATGGGILYTENPPIDCSVVECGYGD